jgi:hypothetical protein
MSEQYIIHGTPNIIKILEDGYINNNVSKKDLYVLNKSSGQIFTQLIFYDLPNESIQQPCWGAYSIVLNTEILKDLPFYATNIGGFLNNFQDAFSDKCKDTYKQNEIIIKSPGYLSKIPNLRKLKNFIKKRMIHLSTDETAFIHSHEILFGQKIYLKDYCKCIVIREDESKEDYIQIKMLCDKLDIPLVVRELRKDKIYRYYTGLNNLLDYIKHA